MKALPRWVRYLALSAFACIALVNQSLAASDPLASWNEGPNKQAIVEFVKKTTDQSSPDYLSPPTAPEHPEWKTTQSFKAVLDGDMKTLAASGEKGLLQLVMATHAGMSTAEFEAEVKDWFDTATHPRFKRSYTEMTYKPMVELLEYLRANGFKTFIVSGGGIEFMRPIIQEAYGIPPEQVIGSSIKTEFEIKNGKPVLMRQPEINFIDDKAGKPVGINMCIGRRPIAAFGNSNGDVQMLEWTAAGEGARVRF